MKVCRTDGYKVMPWKNGGGSTTEIAIAPEGASLDGFDWRLSMARIERDGPFSSFPGIDRTLTLLDGPRVELAVNGDRHVLTPAVPSVRFAGEDSVAAAVPGGPINDFNVMTRRARCSHRFERIQVEGEIVLSHAVGTAILFLAEGDSLACGNGHGGKAALQRRDSLLLGPDDAGDWRLTAMGPATLFVVSILPQA